MCEEKIKIELPVKEINKRGTGWITKQMENAGMKRYPYTWRGKGLDTVVIEGVKCSE
jgi:hypothetical protein